MTFTQLWNATRNGDPYAGDPYAGDRGLLPAAPTPVTVRRARTMARINREDASDRWMRQRRQAAREAGYRGPLTRAELAAQVKS